MLAGNSLKMSVGVGFEISSTLVTDNNLKYHNVFDLKGRNHHSFQFLKSTVYFLLWCFFTWFWWENWDESPLKLDHHTVFSYGQFWSWSIIFSGFLMIASSINNSSRVQQIWFKRIAWYILIQQPTKPSGDGRFWLDKNDSCYRLTLRAPII